MKILFISIIAVTFLLLVPMMMNDQAKAICMPNSDWPSAPCYGCPGCIPSKEKQREEWNPYYQYKGTIWMEMMKTQMIGAMKNGTLEDWVTGNDSNYDAWRYYYLNDQAPFFRSSVSGLNDEPHYIPPPLQQLKTGIESKDVACKKGLQLFIKPEDGSPACVRPDTANILIHRGWAKEVSQTLSHTTPIVSSTPCDISYPKSNVGVAVLYMSTNSTGKICATYHNSGSPTQSSVRVFTAKDVQQMASEIITSAHPDIVPTGNSTIVYDIKTGSQAGLYGMSFFCGSIPFAVGYDNQSRIILDDFPWLYKNDICLSQTNVFQITGLSGIDVKYVTVAHRGQLQ